MDLKILLEICPVARKVGVLVNDMEFYPKSSVRNEMAEQPDWSAAIVIRIGCDRANRRKHTVFLI